MSKHFSIKPRKYQIPGFHIFGGNMKKKLGNVMNEELYIDEDNYSRDFRDFLIGDEKISVNSKL